VAAIIEIVHVCIVVLDVYNLIILIRSLCACRIGAFDVLNTGQRVVVLDVWGHVLGIRTHVICIVVLNERHRHSLLLPLCMIAILTKVFQNPLVLHINIHHVFAQVAEPHLYILKENIIFPFKQLLFNF